MNSLLMLTALVIGQAPPPATPQPAPPLQPDAKSEYPEIEELIGRVDPRQSKDPIMCHTHILMYWAGGKKRIMKVKMINTETRPNVFLSVFDTNLYPVNRLKLPVILLIEGELHYGTAPRGVPRMRWKVKEWRGRKYNEQRHWRTDRAVYILRPTFKPIKEGVDWQAEKKAWIEQLNKERQPQ